MYVRMFGDDKWEVSNFQTIQRGVRSAYLILADNESVANAAKISYQ